MKQAIILRTDLQMSTGKFAVQACHASVAAVLAAPLGVVDRWNTEGQTKIVLGARSLSELVRLQEQCEAKGLTHSLISDAGRTELPSGTVTALAIGPAEDRWIDQITGGLPLLK